jgi:hypothetical protein
MSKLLKWFSMFLLRMGRACQATTLFICGLSVLFLASMIYVAVSTAHRDAPLHRSNMPCGAFPANTSRIQLSKQLLKVWHWRYDVLIDSVKRGYVQMRCPSVRHDLNVKIGNAFVGRTDGKVLSLESEIGLLDCHNRPQYVLRTGSAFQTLVNTNEIWVSLEVRQGTKIKYFVRKNVFFTDNIDLYDELSVKVATLTRNVWNDVLHFRGYTWNINVLDVINHPVDPFLLVTIAAQHAFSQTDKKGNDVQDTCNDFFSGTWIFMFLTMAALCILLLAGLYKVCQSGL